MFYDKFEAHCREAGKAPRDVAKEVGVKTSTLSMWKTKGVTPKYGTIKRIADALGIEWLDLVPPEQQDNLVVDYVKGLEKEIRAQQEILTSSMEAISNLENEFFSRFESIGISRKDAVIFLSYSQLNEEGKREAIKRVDELALIPKYRRDSNSPGNLL